MGLSLPHVLLLVVVGALLLGGGRFSALLGDVAKGVKQFKKGMAEADEAPPPQLGPPNNDAAPIHGAGHGLGRQQTNADERSVA